MPSNWQKKLLNKPTITEVKIWLKTVWPLSQTQPSLANWLLAFILNCPPHQIASEPKCQLTLGQWFRLRQAVKKLALGYPLAYLIGQQDFYGRTFKVNKHTLIPRPESECLIDIAKDLNKTFTEPTAWIDLGTGSGCLAISLALELGPNNYYGASDISLPTLKMAQSNAKALSANIDWHQGSLLEPWLNEPELKKYKNLVIVANLPYLDPKDYQNNFQELRFEPKSALVSGIDGLALFSKLARELPIFIANHPEQKIHLLTESRIDHVTTLESLLSVSDLIWQQAHPDLTGRQRFGYWHN
ncbi:MAG TPA: peptide chain release factor N(5)-glutamine methyltransferase [bacterium]|nr:peptide chain release factor N(5)-glutamine methyltransferase [bacterium]